MSHTGEHASFIEAKAASVGLETLVETGPPSGFPDQPGLVDELNDAVKRTGVVAAGAYTHGDTVADPNDTVGEVPGAPLIDPDGAFEFGPSRVRPTDSPSRACSARQAICFSRPVPRGSHCGRRAASRSKGTSRR